jgi:hypothetical protein
MIARSLKVALDSSSPPRSYLGRSSKHGNRGSYRVVKWNRIREPSKNKDAQLIRCGN